MPNEISDINSGRSQQPGDRKTVTPRRDKDASASDDSSTSPTSPASHSDAVTLADMAAHLQSLEQELAAQPDIDQEHINRVRSAISSGEYRVDADRVADKMIDFDSDFES